MELVLFRLLYFFIFFSLSSLGGMLIPFLQYKGYDPIHTGTLIGLYTLSGMSGQFVVGYFCDKLRTIKKIFLPTIVCIMISATVAILFTNRIIFYIGFLTMGFFYYILAALIDSWVLENDESIKSKFGPIRSFGSIGWALGVLVGGIVISRLGYYVLNIIYVASLLVALIICIKLKDTVKECKEKISFKPILVNKEYMIIVFTLLSVSISFRAYCQLVPYTIAAIGGNTANLGVFSFICSASEILMLIICSKIMHKFSPDKLIILTPIVMIIQLGILYMSNNIIMMYLGGTLQLFTFPILLMVGRIMIDRVSPQNLKTSAQLIGFAIFNTLGIIISAFCIGFIVEKYGVYTAILITMAFTIIGIISTILCDRKIKDKTL